MTSSAILAIYNSAADKVRTVTYGYDRQPALVRAMSGLGVSFDRIIVAVGGYKLEIVYAGALLVSIRPKASSAGRGSLTLDAVRGGTMSLDIDSGPFAGVSYFLDGFGPSKLQAALQVVTVAALAAKGNRSKLYKSLGKSGFCAICGMGLTDPTSMARGIGPECWKQVNKVAALTLVQAHRVKMATKPKSTTGN